MLFSHEQAVYFNDYELLEIVNDAQISLNLETFDTFSEIPIELIAHYLGTLDIFAQIFTDEYIYSPELITITE